MIISIVEVEDTGKENYIELVEDGVIEGQLHLLIWKTPFILMNRA